MVAALRPEKNHVQLLEAVVSLRALGVRAQALLVGDGAMRETVERRARALGIDRQLTVTGFREAVRPYLAACDAVTVCSLTEALSLAAIEAMAMGRPLIHSAVGGAAELIEHGRSGLLFPPGDTAALTACLLCGADRETAMKLGGAARATVESHFRESCMVERYESLLLELCAWRGGSSAHSPEYIS